MFESEQLLWWVIAFQLFAIFVMAIVLLVTRHNTREAIEVLRYSHEHAIAEMRERLNAYKLEVAKTYTSIPYLKEVERRLTSHLIAHPNNFARAARPRWMTATAPAVPQAEGRKDHE